MHEKLKKILADYYAPGKFAKWLFPSDASASGHLTRAAAHNVLTKAFEILGLEDASTHLYETLMPNFDEPSRGSFANHTGDFRTCKS
jgi:hypothetical protein